MPIIRRLKFEQMLEFLIGALSATFIITLESYTSRDEAY